MQKTVLGFSRTIYELGKETGGFLDPWTSLQPGFLRTKIAPEILGVFRRTSGGLRFDPFFAVKKNKVDPDQLDHRWALVFPKRSYLPPDYPHLQLWLLSRNYVPSPKFLRPQQLRNMTEISSAIKNVFLAYGRRLNKKGTLACGYNSTPFSFIRDEEGRYFAGGQSVRVFHLHFLLIPPAKKIRVRTTDFSLVYPTDFSLRLLHLVFGQREIANIISLPASAKIIPTRRGIEIQSDRNLSQEYLRDLDRILYRLQYILVNSFYQDSRKLIKRINEMARVNDVAKIEQNSRKLLLVGWERNLEEIKSVLRIQLFKFARSCDLCFNREEVEKVISKLDLAENGDLASWLFSQKVILRPGMGYGLLEEIKGEKTRVKIHPLDVLGSKGLIESSGYWFSRRLVRHKYPSWAVDIMEDIIKRFSHQ